MMLTSHFLDGCFSIGAIRKKGKMWFISPMEVVVQYPVEKWWGEKFYLAKSRVIWDAGGALKIGMPSPVKIFPLLGLAPAALNR